MKKFNLSQKRKLNATGFFVLILMVGIILCLVNSGIINRYQGQILVQICYNIILAVSLNLVVGFLGQLPLGHAGFMSVGAYSSALLTQCLTLPSYIEFPIALLAVGGGTAVCGIIIGLPALRLKGDYLSIITLGFCEIIRVTILNLKITGGATGLRGIENHTDLEWAMGMLILTIIIIHTFIKSRHGRAIKSIREDAFAAEITGIPVTYYKVFTFALSACLAGMAGALYAHNICFLDASNFGFLKSMDLLIIVVLGGLGSIFGTIISAIIITILPELLRDFMEYRMIVYAVLLIGTMMFKPYGLFGDYEFSFSHLISKTKNIFSKAKLLDDSSRKDGD